MSNSLTFGPFRVREAPKRLLRAGSVLWVRLTDTHLHLVGGGGEDIDAWPRDQVQVEVRSDYYGVLRRGRDSVWVNTGGGRPLQVLGNALVGISDAGDQVVDAESLAADARGVFAGSDAVVIRVYPGRTQGDAASLFRQDAAEASKYGYLPTSQSWSEGRPGIGRFVALGLAALVFKPAGYLSVTYTRATAPGTPNDPVVAQTKTCPMCAEDVKEAAKICRFCRYEFEPLA